MSADVWLLSHMQPHVGHQALLSLVGFVAVCEQAFMGFFSCVPAHMESQYVFVLEGSFFSIAFFPFADSVVFDVTVVDVLD